MRANTQPGIEDLYREHALGLVLFALLLTGDRATAEDVVQDAFLGLHRHWDGVKDPGRVLAYLRTAVVTGSRSSHRRHLVARRLRPEPLAMVQSAEALVLAGETGGHCSGVGVDVVARSALKTRDDHIRGEAVDL